MSYGIDAKLCSLENAIERIEDGKTVATSGFCGAGHPEALTAAIEKSFLETGKPQNLTLVYAAGQGDGQSRGLNHFQQEGMVKRTIGGHWRLAPGLGKLAAVGKIEAYNFPQGVICQLFRDIAAGRPGCITHVGLDTFVDPTHGGGRLNDITPPGLVERITLGDRDWLWYKSFPIDVALIRGTTADIHGSITVEKEAVCCEVLAIAQAVRNSGGIVIAQVQHLRDTPTPPHQVVVPGMLIDHIVVADPEQHSQTFAEQFNPSYCNAPSPQTLADAQAIPIDNIPRRLIAARSCDEVPDNAIANLGIGIPEGIAQIAQQRGDLERFTLTLESGAIGGSPAAGLAFGATSNPQAIIEQTAQFDFYDGGGLDFAALGAAQIDA